MKHVVSTAAAGSFAGLVLITGLGVAPATAMNATTAQPATSQVVVADAAPAAARPSSYNVLATGSITPPFGAFPISSGALKVDYRTNRPQFVGSINSSNGPSIDVIKDTLISQNGTVWLNGPVTASGGPTNGSGWMTLKGHMRPGVLVLSGSVVINGVHGGPMIIKGLTLTPPPARVTSS